MRATGTVRRIDNLGRNVIPKEIQRSLKLKEGSALEIFTQDNSIIFKKYDEKKAKADRIRNMEKLLGFLCSIRTYEDGSEMTIENGSALCSVTDVEDWLKTEVN